VSELLDRIQKEIRERLEASRAAVREHERLEAALQALGDAGSRATRAVAGRARGSSSQERPGGTGETVDAPTPSRRAPHAHAAAAASARKRGSSGRAAAKPRQGAGRASTRTAAKTTSKAGTTRPRKPARKRAAPGANREAVLRVVGERPGVTARELATTAGVTGGTLYSLLRRLTQDGTLEKRELPGGQTGYALATPDTETPSTQPAVVAADMPQSEPADQDTAEGNGASA
jgi:hypothetical protein